MKLSLNTYVYECGRVPIQKALPATFLLVWSRYDESLRISSQASMVSYRHTSIIIINLDETI